MLSGYVRDAEVYHNTVIASASGAVRAPAVRVKGMHTGVALRNNLFVSTDTGLVASRAYRPSEVVFQGNVYFARSGKWAIGWGDKVHSTLGSWRAATGQERVGPAVSGIAADPRLGVAGVPKLGPDSAYVPRAGSPAIGRALDLRTLFGTDPGETDFLGQPVDGPAAVGAVQPLANG